MRPAVAAGASAHRRGAAGVAQHARQPDHHAPSRARTATTPMADHGDDAAAGHRFCRSRARAELDERVEERLRDLILIGARGELRFLLGVGEVADLDERGRHVGADQHAERRLLHRRAGSSRCARAAPARRSRPAPPTVRDSGPAPSPTGSSSMAREPPPSAGSTVAFSLGLLARFGFGALDGQVVDLGALERRAHRGVGVDAEEHVGLVVVGERRRDRRATSCGRLSRVRNTLEPEPAFDQRAQPARDRERDLFLERASRALRAESPRRRDRDRSRRCECPR